MSQHKPLAASIVSLVMSIKLVGALQLIVVFFAVIAGYYAWRRNKAESEIAEFKLKKLKGDRDG